MSIERTLQRVDEDIARGDLGKARERLHSLVHAFPQDLSIRSRLAEIYWKLQYPSQAGCFWYLQEPTGDEMRRAIEAFEKRCGGDPVEMLRNLRLGIDPGDLPEGYAQSRIVDLVARCTGRHPNEIRVSRKAARLDRARPGRIRDRVQLFTCGTILSLVALVFVAGAFQICSWLLDMFATRP